MDGTGLSQLAETQNLDISMGKMLAVVLVVGAAWGLANLTRLLLDLLAERLGSQRLLFKRMQPLARIVIYASAMYFVVGIVSPEERTLYAMLGSMALAIGLAAKDLLNDLIGGIVVLFDRSYQAGDRVQVGDHYGEVVTIGLRSTKLVTPDDSLVTVPNSVMLSSTVSNSNAGQLESQVVVDIFLPGVVDLDEVQSVAREAALTSKLTYLSKPVVVLVKDRFDETQLTQVAIKAYVFDARFESALAADLTRRVRRELDRRGLTAVDSRYDAPVPSP